MSHDTPGYSLSIDHGAGPDQHVETLCRFDGDRITIEARAERIHGAWAADLDAYIDSNGDRYEPVVAWAVRYPEPPVVTENPWASLARDLERGYWRPMAGEGPRGVVGLAAGGVKP